jgi:hypothetical protein
MKTNLRSLLLLGILITVVSGPAASACSRATWLG